MIPDNSALIADGRAIAISVHRIGALRPGDTDFAVDVQVLRNGVPDLENTATVGYDALLDVLRCSTRGEKSRYVVGCPDGVTLQIQTGKHTHLRLRIDEVQRIVRACRRLVARSAAGNP